MTSSSSSVVPVTYKSVNLKNRKILARSDAADILSTLKEWSSTDTSDEDKINSWMNQGLVFWLDDNSADSSVELVSLESINDDATSNSQSQFESTGIANNELELVDGEDNNDGVIVGLPNKAYTTADVYINLDKDDSDTLRLLKASKANLASKLKSDEDLTRELVEKGEIFTNMEWMCAFVQLDWNSPLYSSRSKNKSPPLGRGLSTIDLRRVEKKPNHIEFSIDNLLALNSKILLNDL